MRAIRTLLVALPILSLVPQSVLADLYVVGSDTKSVRRYSDQGEFIGDFVAPGAGGLVAPSGLAFGPDGNLYVADNVSNQILRFGPDGTFMDVFAADPLLNGPTDLVFGGGYLFVALWNNLELTGGVARVDGITGAVEAVFGTGTFRRTHSIALGADGSLYSSNIDLAQIRVFEPETGEQLRAFGSDFTLGLPMGITFNHDGHLIVSNWNGDVRLIDSLDGSWLSTLASGLNNTQWNAFAPDGALIIDSFNDRSLMRLDTDGSLESFADLGVVPDKFIFYERPPEP